MSNTHECERRRMNGLEEGGNAGDGYDNLAERAGRHVR
jgi:hypothetical protein